MGLGRAIWEATHSSEVAKENLSGPNKDKTYVKKEGSKTETVRDTITDRQKREKAAIDE